MKGFQASFIQGEIAPSLHGRVDVDFYNKAAKTIKNFIIKPTGGVENRPGTYYKGNPEDNPCVLHYFKSGSTTYILIFGDEKMYVAKVASDDVDLVMDGASPYEEATSFTDAELPSLKFAQAADTLYVTSDGTGVFKITSADDDDWTIASIAEGYGPWYRNKGNKTATITATYTSTIEASSVNRITASESVFESGDVGKYLLAYFFNDDESDAQLRIFEITVYISGTVVTVDMPYIPVTPAIAYDYLGNFCFQESDDFLYWGTTVVAGSGSFYILGTYPEKYAYITTTYNTTLTISQSCFVPENKTLNAAVTLLVSGTSNLSITLKVGTTAGASDLLSQSVTLSTSARTTVGNISTGANAEIFVTLEIVTTTASPTINVYFIGVLPQNGQQTREDNWSISIGEVSGEYFRAICVNDQRLVLAGTDNYPNRVEHSNVADYENFIYSYPYEADDSISYEITGGGGQGVKWMEDFEGLIIGTLSGIYKVTGGESPIITAFDVYSRKRTNIGCSNISPKLVSRNLLIVQKSEKDIYQMQESNEAGYIETLINYLSSHLFEDASIVDWAYQHNPYKMLWVVLDDGTLLGCTYIPDQGVYAWQQFEFDGEVQAVESAPSDTTDVLLLQIKRSIDGGNVYYLEKLMPRTIGTITSAILYAVDPDDAEVDDFFFLDCGLTYTTPGTATLTGLDHLEAESVYCLADGSVIGPYTVSSGSITIDRSDYGKVHVGLTYESVLEMLDLSRIQGARKRVSDLNIQLYKTRALQAGKDSDHLEDIIFTDAGQGGAPEDLFTGFKNPEIEYPDDEVATLYFKNDEPVPCTILTVIPVFE